MNHHPSFVKAFLLRAIEAACECIVTRQFSKSVVGLTCTYNLLPQIVVDAPIEISQRFSQHALIAAVHRNVEAVCGDPALVKLSVHNSVWFSKHVSSI